MQYIGYFCCLIGLLCFFNSFIVSILIKRNKYRLKVRGEKQYLPNYYSEFYWAMQEAIRVRKFNNVIELYKVRLFFRDKLIECVDGKIVYKWKIREGVIKTDRGDLPELDFFKMLYEKEDRS